MRVLKLKTQNNDVYSSLMRYFAILAGLLPAVGFAQASAQVQAWTKDHFGLQIEFPGSSSVQNYARVAQSNGTYVYQPSGPSRNYWDSQCQPWQDAYKVLGIMPRGSWVRAAVNIWEHFPSASTTVPVDYERFQSAITGKVLYPNLPSTVDGLNLLWVLSPGIPLRDSSNDGWFDNPRTRDWYVPAPVNRPYLRNQIQSFITAVNNFSVDQAKVFYGTGKVTSNIVSRMGFQLSNEVGAAHPGGTVFGPPGNWNGIGQVLEDTTNGLRYRPDDNYAAKLAGGTTWTNPLSMPAFSFLTEARGQAFVNYNVTWTAPRSIQWPGATVPGLTEVFSYYDEVFGPTNNYGWAAQCTRRSVHFRSPVIQWIRGSDGLRVMFVPVNSDGTFDGRWETATEYAKRWVDEVALAIKGYGRLPMPAAMPTVDLTECYLTYGELNSQILTTGNYSFVAANGTPKTTDQIRSDALKFGSTGQYNGVSYVAPTPPTRVSIFAAIREELYARATAGKLPNLGRIYWVNGYTSDPRRETGFESVDPITSYNPWNDFRLSTDEIKTLFGTI